MVATSSAKVSYLCRSNGQDTRAIFEISQDRKPMDSKKASGWKYFSLDDK
jgi:hypothetical protein